MNMHSEVGIKYEDILGGKIQNTAQAVDSYFHKGIGHNHRALYFGKDLWRSL